MMCTHALRDRLRKEQRSLSTPSAERTLPEQLECHSPTVQSNQLPSLLVQPSAERVDLTSLLFRESAAWTTSLTNTNYLDTGGLTNGAMLGDRLWEAELEAKANHGSAYFLKTAVHDMAS
jgi:hypothetical protein